MKDLIDVLLPEVGTKESPPGSNNVKYNTWFYGKEVSGKDKAWCMVLMSWGLYLIGRPLVGVKTKDGKKVNFGYSKGAAGCATALKCFELLGWIVDAKDAKRGDLVFYDWDGNGLWDHVEAFFEKLGENQFRVIGGNTSKGNDSDGGEVLDRSDRKYVYANPKTKLKFVRIPENLKN